MVPHPHVLLALFHSLCIFGSCFDHTAVVLPRLGSASQSMSRWGNNPRRIFRVLDNVEYIS